MQGVNILSTLPNNKFGALSGTAYIYLHTLAHD